MRSRTITMLMSVALALALAGCSAQLSGPSSFGETPVSRSPVDDNAGGSSVSTPLLYWETAPGSPGKEPQVPESQIPESPAVESQAVASGNDKSGSSPVAVATSQQTEKVPSGTVALFYRVNFGSDTQSLKTVVTDARGKGNYGIAVSTWSTGSKGIVRYIPATGQTDVIKTITSPSYSKSAIYPITVGDRLYSIRDWGSDWTAANKRFTVEELDPHTGATLNSLDISAEWFTFLNDRVFFKSKVTENYWNGSRSGGKLKVQSFGSSEVQDLAVEGVRFHAVADRLVSVNQQEIRWYDPNTANIQSTNYVEALFEENIWPDARHIFYGDRSVLWAWSEPGSKQIDIIRAPFAGEPEVLISFDLEGYETGLVIDEHKGMVLIGVASSAPPRGIGITQMFLMDTGTGSTIELSAPQHIAAAQPDAGGGVQLLVMP